MTARYDRMYVASTPVRMRLTELTGHETYFKILVHCKVSDVIHLVPPRHHNELRVLLQKFNGYCTAAQ